MALILGHMLSYTYAGVSRKLSRCFVFVCFAVRVVQRQLNWEETDEDDAEILWSDTSAGTDRLVRLSRPQKLNHFPSMSEVARKKGLARNLANMRSGLDCHPINTALSSLTEAQHPNTNRPDELMRRRTLFPQHYDFNPRTFLLPEQFEAFQAELVLQQSVGESSNPRIAAAAKAAAQAAAAVVAAVAAEVAS
jgi:hypothetical protein